MMFSKSTCPFCTKIKNLLTEKRLFFKVLELDQKENGAELQTTLAEFSGQRTVPNVFIHGKHIGGCDDTLRLDQAGTLMSTVAAGADADATASGPSADYDLVVIGGGSGGLAASKEAARYGAKVALLDYVTPSPLGTKWGLGGTCVNVGCIPKKLMHQAALLAHGMEDAPHYGWPANKEAANGHQWDTLRDNVQDHIGSINWGYRKQLREESVEYVNALGRFVDASTVEATDKAGKVRQLTAKRFLLATGERPRYPSCPGARELAVTSDDLFSMASCPGETVVVGASYVALECAGFLAALGLKVTVLVRSILLRGFDQQMAGLIGQYMAAHGVEFQYGLVPSEIKLKEGTGSRKVLTARKNDGTEVAFECDTVLLAIGRDPCTSDLGLDKVGVALSKTGKVVVDADECTSVKHISAIGDIGLGRPELTPAAIQAGRQWAQRIYGGATLLTDYTKVATTVFTPIEYGCCGLSEEAATEKFGDADIEVFHTYFKPLEWTVAHREDNACYLKLICRKSDELRVIGLHYLGPNAGEVTQGYAVAITAGATKATFDNTIGIHPTCSEVFTTLETTKSSGQSAEAAGC